MRPTYIKNISDVTSEGYEKKDEGIAGASRDIGGAIGVQRLGVDVTTIRPGKKSSRLHHHKNKEEFFYVLEGRCRLKIGTEIHDLRPGDAIARPAGSGVPHQFFNPYPKPCDVMMIGVMNGGGLADEIHWPELKLAAKITATGKRKLVKLKK